jgi:hypothetical protein
MHTFFIINQLARKVGLLHLFQSQANASPVYYIKIYLIFFLTDIGNLKISMMQLPCLSAQREHLAGGEKRKTSILWGFEAPLDRERGKKKQER